MATKYQPYIIEKAIEFRLKENLGIDEISERLNVPPEIVNKWLVDYPIKNNQTEGQKRKAKMIQDRFANLREKAYEDGLAEAPELFKNRHFRDFINLYLAEGTKRGRNTVEIVNSNAPVMILAYHFIKLYANPENTFFFYIQIHVSQNPDEIKNYWAEQIGIKPEEIKIKRISTSNRGEGRKFNSPYGVFTIQVGDTYLRARLQAWMDYLRKQWLDNFGN